MKTTCVISFLFEALLLSSCAPDSNMRESQLMFPPSLTGDPMRDNRKMEKYIKSHGVNKVRVICGFYADDCMSVDVSDSNARNLDWIVGINIGQLRVNNTAITDASPISMLCNLTLLEINDTAISDISALSNLSKLASLEMENTMVSDLSPLNSLQLYNLNISGTLATNLSHIQTSRLHRLEISSIPDIKFVGWEHIGRMTNLILVVNNFFEDNTTFWNLKRSGLLNEAGLPK